MNCLCCGKALKENEISTGWHRRCVRQFFGTKTLPEIQIDDHVLKELAQKTTENGFTVPGVQKKLSLHLSMDQSSPRLTMVDYPLGYILKPAVEDYPCLPESEHLVMSMADVAGIQTVPHALIKSQSGYAYITKRVDRIHDRCSKKLAMEDFCQLDLRLTQDKYRGSYERCAKIIRKYSSQSGLDMAEFFVRLVFCYIVGNSDMHLKNFSLIERVSEIENSKSSIDTIKNSGSIIADSGKTKYIREYILSPAYDLLPVNLLIPEDLDQTALTLCGKKRNLHRNDLLKFAESVGIKRISAEKMIRRIVSKEQKFTKLIDDSLISDEMKEKMKELMEYRISCL